MVRCLATFFCFGVLAVYGTPRVQAQQPVGTYSVEAVALNGVPLPGAPVKLITASPGEIITAEIYLRDWSPNGEDLHAYQVQLDDKAFTGLISGSIKPSGYDAAREEKIENVANAFIDLNRPDFVHAGSQTIAITDTKRAPGYRWLSVLIDIDKAPISPQDGTKFYCGTVLLTVSADASGVFNIGPETDPAVSALLTEGRRTLGPLNYEPLEITVVEGVVRRNIVASDPPTGAIDARMVTGSAMTSGGWQTIQLTFDSDATAISEKEFSVTSGSGAPPSIKSVAARGNSLTLTLDHTLRPGAWTAITHNPTGHTLRFGVLPGDVDGNGTRNSRDFMALLELLGTDATSPAYRADLNGDGTTDARDALAMIDCLVAHLSSQIVD